MEELIKKRTKKIGLEVIKLIDDLPNKPSSWVLSKQIGGSATSVGANYRAACRAKSDADFANKLKIVEEEADEALYWLEILEESEIVKPERVEALKIEVDQVIAIIVASLRTLRNKSKPGKAL